MSENMRKGKIYKILSNFYYVKIDNNMYECKAKGRFKNDGTDILVGDNVEIEIIDNDKLKGNIVKVLKRKNFTVRPSVANLDKLIIIVSLTKPAIDYMLLDKQIIYCIKNDIKPVICINKIDNSENKEYLKIKEVYEKIGYSVYPISAKLNIGINDLKKELKDSVCVFAGVSGVGKSTLTNCICDEYLNITGGMSKISRGKHTTRHVEIFEYDDFYIVDTPGFSVFDIEDIPKKELYMYFEEFMEYTDKCQYRDCTHIKEEKCGVKEAVENNEIDINRYERFKQLYESIKR